MDEPTDAPSNHPLTPQQVADLFARLARIEKQLGLTPNPVAKVEPVSEVLPPPLPASPEPVVHVNPLDRLTSLKRAALTGDAPNATPRDTTPTVPVTAPVQSVNPPAIPATPPPLPIEVRTPPPLPVPPPVPATVDFTPPPPLFPPGESALERAVGGRWYAIAGALILIAGVALGFKWAYDAGLLRVSPLYRCLAGVGFGAALIVAGEWLRKKFSEWAGAGATAAGIGSIYVSSFVAYRVFDLINAPTAFIILGLVAVMGVALSARSGLAAVGTISLVGGFVTPFLFRDTAPRDFVMPLYLLMLLAIGLSLAVWKRGAFAALRITASMGTILVGGLWASSQDGYQAWIAIGYLAIAWAMLHAELLLAAKRPVLVSDGEPFANFAPWRILPVSLGSTAWAVTVSSHLLSELAFQTWPASLIASIATGVLSLSLSRQPWQPNLYPLDPARRLSVLLIAECAILAMVTIATALAGRAELAAWIGLAAAAAWTGRRISSIPIIAYGLVGLLVAVARLLLWDSWQGDMHQSPTMVLGIAVTEWSVWMVVAAGVSLYAAFSWPVRAWVAVRHLLANAGCVLAALSLAHPDTRSWPASVTIACMAIGMAALSRPPFRFITAFIAAFALVISEVLWLRMYGTRAHPPVDLGFLSAGFWIGLWTAASCGIAGWILPRDEKLTSSLRLPFFVAASALVLVTVAAALTGRQELAAWLGLAIAAALVGRRMSSVPVASYGLITLGIAILRLLLWDAWRGGLHQSPTMVLGVAVTEWSLWMLAAAGVCFFTTYAWPMRISPIVRQVLANAVCVLAALSLAHEDTTPEAASVALAAMAIGMAALTRPPLFFITAPVTSLAIAASTVLWFRVYIWEGYPPVDHGALSPGFWIGLWTAASCGIAGWLVPRLLAPNAAFRTPLIVAAWVIFFACTSIEAGRIARALSTDPTMRAAGVSIWWGIFSIGLLGYGFRSHIAAIRWVGLILLAVAGFKTVLLDLADVEPLPRVISFLGLGLMMILVPAIYSRLGGKIGVRGEISASEPAPEPPLGKDLP